MPDAIQHPIKVVVPWYGVRAQVVGNQVRVAVGDDGGKGRPWQAVFIPVVLNGDRLVLVDKQGQHKPDPDMATFNASMKDKKIPIQQS